ncbi:MAG TPA: acylphosphatase [Verrucomicrobiae bacterium]|nr:acylphosphatase [Verrucomicrobiae bacterium]
MPTLHIIVKGRVQGVFFRASAQEAAETCGVKGWVRNTEEGDVELMATGTEEALKKLVDWCHQGPRRAEVSEVITERREEESFAGFKVLR